MLLSLLYYILWFLQYLLLLFFLTSVIIISDLVISPFHRQIIGLRKCKTLCVFRSVTGLPSIRSHCTRHGAGSPTIKKANSTPSECIFSSVSRLIVRSVSDKRRVNGVKNRLPFFCFACVLLFARLAACGGRYSGFVGKLINTPAIVLKTPLRPKYGLHFFR